MKHGRHGPGSGQAPWEQQQPQNYGRQYPPQDRGRQYPQPGYGQQYPQDQPRQPQYDPSAHQQRLQGPSQQPAYPPQGYGQQYPPQGQAWPQPGYGQPPYPGQSWYAPGGPPPRGRRRHTVRYVLAGLGALVVVIIAVAVANSGSGHSVKTAGSTTGAGTPGAGTPTAAAAKKAGIGSAITLAGNDSGEQMTVTVTKVITSATENDGLSLTPAGDRLYAVQFRLTDTGSAAYSDSPPNGAAVVDSKGQSYQPGFETVNGCQSFPATENIAPGASGLGCVVFEVAKSAVITEVQFTLDSGFGPQTGQWNVG